MTKPPQLDSNRLEQELANLSRVPFRDVLELCLQAAPTEKAIRDYAQKSPDRWGQLVTMLAKLSGYNETIKHEATFAVLVHEMSDAELYKTLGDLMKAVGVDQTTMLDITPEDTP